MQKSVGDDFKLVYIEWEDSYGCSSTWEDIENCSPDVMVCRSVGWLIHDDKKCKVIVPHMNEPFHPNVKRQGCGDMTIPTASVIKVVELTLTKRKKRRD
jgi:hypothetical protein